MKISILRALLFMPIMVMTFSGTAYAAGGDMPTLVADIGVSLLLAGLLGVVFTKLKIPSIAAFLLAGIIIGPVALGIVNDPANIDTIAQLGFILLLFMIGLEIDVSKILASGKTIIITGILQYPICVIFGILLTKLLLIMGIGTTLLEGPYAPIYLGIVIAGSSTLLVIKLFQENFELGTEPGKIALGILIFQDIWAIIAILIQPNLDDPQIMPILISFIGIAVLILLSVILARTLISKGFQWIAKVPELILLGAVSWCFIVVFLGLNLDNITEYAFGFNLHIAVGSGMGALIAGATIASLPYSTEIITKVGVVKDFFVTLFFVGLGMSIPAPDGWSVPLLAIILAVAAILARQIIFFPLLYWLGSDQRNAEVSSIRLAQISEFGLVIAFLGVQLGHLSPELTSAIIFAFVITALLTSPIYDNAYSLHEKMSGFLAKIGFKLPQNEEVNEDDDYDLVLLGFYRDASSLLHNIATHSPDRLSKILVIDFNVAKHEAIKSYGVHVDYGDLSNSETLLHAGIDKGKVIMCTIPDDILRGITNVQLTRTVHELVPDATIISNAIAVDQCEALYSAGADYVYMNRVESARSLEIVMNEALNGSLEEYKENELIKFGELTDRKEVI